MGCRTIKPNLDYRQQAGAQLERTCPRNVSCPADASDKELCFCCTLTAHPHQKQMLLPCATCMMQSGAFACHLQTCRQVLRTDFTGANCHFYAAVTLTLTLHCTWPLMPTTLGWCHCTSNSFKYRLHCAHTSALCRTAAKAYPASAALPAPSSIMHTWTALSELQPSPCVPQSLLGSSLHQLHL